MRKLITLFVALFLVAPVSFAGNAPVEDILNNVYDSTNTAIKAEISGNADMTDISCDTLTADTIGLNYNGGVSRGATLTADNLGFGLKMTDNVYWYSDGSDIYQKWSDGYLYLQTDEGTNTSSVIWSKAKGASASGAYTYMGCETDANHINMYAGLSANGIFYNSDGNDAFNLYSQPFANRGTTTNLAIEAQLGLTAYVFNEQGRDADLRVETENNSAALVVNSDSGAANEYVSADIAVFMPNLKSGANQGAAGASKGELWHDTNDNTIKLGV